MSEAGCRKLGVGGWVSEARCQRLGVRGVHELWGGRGSCMLIVILGELFIASFLQKGRGGPY